MSQPTGEHCVAVVVDPDFGEALLSLAEQQHVWICDSARNHEHAYAVWRKQPSHSLERGVTTFDWDRNASAEHAFLDLLETVDLHHGRTSHSPGWRRLRVFGARATPEVRAALAVFGAHVVAEGTNDFEAERPVGPA